MRPVAMYLGEKVKLAYDVFGMFVVPFLGLTATMTPFVVLEFTQSYRILLSIWPLVFFLVFHETYFCKTFALPLVVILLLKLLSPARMLGLDNEGKKVCESEKKNK